MPTVTNPSLTLTTINNTSTKLTVAYDVEFGRVDRNLVSLGVVWHPHIDIIGSNISMAAKMLGFAPSGRVVMGQRARENVGTADLQEIDSADWQYVDERTKGRYRLYVA